MRLKKLKNGINEKMEWHKLVDHPGKRGIHVWLSDGKEVWITNMLSDYWYCVDIHKLRWAYIELPEPPKELYE